MREERRRAPEADAHPEDRAAGSLRAPGRLAAFVQGLADRRERVAGLIRLHRQADALVLEKVDGLYGSSLAVGQYEQQARFTGGRPCCACAGP
jgi:hypothetical protein